MENSNPKNLSMVIPQAESCEVIEPTPQHTKDDAGVNPQISTESGVGNRTVKAGLTGDEFEINENGVYWIEGPRKKKALCGPLRIVGLARDVENRNWTKMVMLKDQDGHIHTHFIQMKDIEGDGLIGTLRSMGLTISPDHKAKEKLMVYLQDCQPEGDNRFRITDKTGWHCGNYVLPDGRTYGNSDERFVYHQPGMGEQPFVETGTFEQWRDSVAKLCKGNSRLIFAVSLAFSATIIDILKVESGGFNFVGNSSTGKSTALYVAASVSGDPSVYIQNWRATTNGLEGTALKFNDALLTLDELGQVEAKDAGSAAYMLTNGQGKKRANTRGDARPRTTWRVMVLSSGETTLGEHMSEAGQRVRAGQEVRLADIPADADAGLGVFEDLHDHENGAQFADILKLNAGKYHGTALPAFLDGVLAKPEVLLKGFKTIKTRFFSTYVPSGASSQVQRLAGRFAMIAAAGEFATYLGITGWAENEASKAAGKCFCAWMGDRGGSEIQEVTSLLRQVRAFFESHGESRFTKMEKKGKSWVFSDRITHHRAGFRREGDDGVEYLVLPEAFRELCRGFNSTFAGKVLMEKGLIAGSSDGKPQTTHRLPDIGPKKVYLFTEKVLADAD